jgi:hypothetical protein
MGRSKWLWRWRSNPLRRRSYAVEAWVLLALVPATVACASFAGVVVAGQSQDRLEQQRAGRHQVAARLTEDAPDHAGYDGSPLALVRWTAPDGTSHTAAAKVTAGLQRGATVVVWNDRRGDLAPPPPSRAAARTDSYFAGVAAATGVGMLALTGWAAAAQMADHRRAQRWEREWARIGPQWDHRTA